MTGNSPRCEDTTVLRDSYLIINPYDPDAHAFIAAMSHTFGMLPICLYTDAKERFYTEQANPELRVTEAAASIEVGPDGFGPAIERLRTRFNIRAVVPFRENYVELAAQLLNHLDVDWMSGDDLAIFRDKHRLKQTISQADPSVRVPESRVVRSVNDVFDRPVPEHFVLKPNDGMGSTNLGYFTADDRNRVADHLGRAPGEVWILEERIFGTEYRINGLVRRDGAVQPLFLSEYVPRQMSNTFILGYALEHQLTTNDERWPELVGYAESLLAAAGLWGSPFHLEVKVDDRGPAMVDLGARVASDGSGWAMSMLHPDRPDLYAIAARDYVGDNDFARSAPDYRFHDAGHLIGICGTSDQTGLVVGIDGIEEVEAMPEFLRWVVRPRIGDPIRVTDDLRSCPYILNLRHSGDRDRSLELEARVREMIRFRVDERPRPWNRVRLAEFAGRSVLRAGWAATGNERMRRATRSAPLGRATR